MKIVTEDKKIGREELRKISQDMFGSFVKSVIDIAGGIMVIDAELHADQEAFLLEQGSRQENLWGINLYPEEKGEDFIEFDSMINLRPSQGNRSRGVDNPQVRSKIIEIVNKLVVDRS